MTINCASIRLPSKAIWPVLAISYTLLLGTGELRGIGVALLAPAAASLYQTSSAFGHESSGVSVLVTSLAGRCNKRFIFIRNQSSSFPTKPSIILFILSISMENKNCLIEAYSYYLYDLLDGSNLVPHYWHY